MNRPPITHLLYLHGFRSSPQSNKARLTREWLGQHRPDICHACPALPDSPAAAMVLLQALVANWPADTTMIIGSSLGGFYAKVLGQRWGGHTLLLNPAPNPAQLLCTQIGNHPAWHDPAATITWEHQHVEELESMQTELNAVPPRPQGAHWALVAQGDEVLDWRLMLSFCAHAQTECLPGGDHALSDFAQRLPALMARVGLIN